MLKVMLVTQVKKKQQVFYGLQRLCQATKCIKSIAEIDMNKKNTTRTMKYAN